MKRNILINLSLFLFLINYAFSGTAEEIISSSSKYLNDDYVNFFKIPLSIMTLFANGDSSSSSNDIWYAFDGRGETYWRSRAKNGETFVNPTNEVEYKSILNSITITFSKTVNFDRILYQFQPSSAAYAKGYPLEFKVYYKIKGSNGSISTKDSDFILFDDIKSDESDEKVLFKLKGLLTCDQVKLEWVDCDRSNAIAAEIALLMPENAQINESILKMFSTDDYRELSLNAEYNRMVTIIMLKSYAENITSISPYAKKFMNKATLAAGGINDPNERREFTTDQTAKVGVIQQVGDVDKYARNKLKMTWVGTNRQVTGIYGKSNEIIKIYVSAGEDDPLPSIIFTQHIGPWQKWKSNEMKLKRGKNYFTFEYFDLSPYKTKVNPGGPIYLINPYTPNQQSSKVKIYIEGGELFPVFRLNGDENAYKDLLYLFAQQDNYLDITELVSQRTIMTVQATTAYEIYKGQGKGPQKNLLIWDKFITNLFTYDGVKFSSTNQYYDKFNEYLNINFRHTQPYGLAYAYTEHIGIFEPDWIEQAIDAVEGNFGWGFAHEIGHMMDIEERKVSETTNNMISKWSVTTLENDNTWGDDHYNETLYGLTRDDTPLLMRGCKEADTSKCNGFFQNWKLNYLIFWNLECYNHGYWGKLENLYRYEYDDTKGMTNTERFVFFSSQVMKMDLGYYFQRWGFSLGNDKLFDVSKTSAMYNTTMRDYQDDGSIIPDVNKKFWYFDQKEYNYMTKTGSGCYAKQEAYTIAIKSVSVSDKNEVVLELPKIDCVGHLGFEIYANNKLIAFTYQNKYTDTTKYQSGSKVTYKIIAYDRLLDYSKQSAVVEAKIPATSALAFLE